MLMFMRVSFSPMPHQIQLLPKLVILDVTIEIDGHVIPPPPFEPIDALFHVAVLIYLLLAYLLFIYYLFRYLSICVYHITVSLVFIYFAS